MNVYYSLKDFTDAIQLIDATAEVYQFNDEKELSDLVETPPVGKVPAFLDAGFGNYIVIFTATGTLAVRYAGIFGGQYVLSPGSALAPPVWGTPVTVLVHDSVKELQDYLKTLDATATVTQYVGTQDIPILATDFKILTGASSKVTVVGCTTGNIPSVLFIRNHGAKFLTVVK